MQKRLNGYKVIIVSLILLLLGSMAMGLALAYFSNHSNLALSVSAPAEIMAIDQGTAAYSLDLKNATDEFKFKIKLPKQLNSNQIRVKFNLNNGQNVDVVLDEHWRQEDNYYYYLNEIAEDETIEVKSKIDAEKFPNENVNIVVETLQQ